MRVLLLASASLLLGCLLADAQDAQHGRLLVANTTAKEIQVSLRISWAKNSFKEHTPPLVWKIKPGVRTTLDLAGNSPFIVSSVNLDVTVDGISTPYSAPGDIGSFTKEGLLLTFGDAELRKHAKRAEDYERIQRLRDAELARLAPLVKLPPNPVVGQPPNPAAGPRPQPSPLSRFNTPEWRAQAEKLQISPDAERAMLLLDAHQARQPQLGKDTIEDVLRHEIRSTSLLATFLFHNERSLRRLIDFINKSPVDPQDRLDAAFSVAVARSNADCFNDVYDTLTLRRRYMEEGLASHLTGAAKSCQDKLKLAADCQTKETRRLSLFDEQMNNYRKEVERYLVAKRQPVRQIRTPLEKAVDFVGNRRIGFEVEAKQSDSPLSVAYSPMDGPSVSLGSQRVPLSRRLAAGSVLEYNSQGVSRKLFIESDNGGVLSYDVGQGRFAISCDVIKYRLEYLGFNIALRLRVE